MTISIMGVSNKFQMSELFKKNSFKENLQILQTNISDS